MAGSAQVRAGTESGVAVTDGFEPYFFAARSSTALAHVPTGFPLRAAAASYAALRAGFSRSSRRSVSGSSIGGLPLPRFGAFSGFMALIISPYKYLDTAILCLYSVRTVNQPIRRDQMQTTKFQAGQTYQTSSICDADMVIRETIVSRTAKTVKTASGKTFRVSEYNGVEQIKPWGSYSMSPRISADKVAA